MPPQELVEAAIGAADGDEAVAIAHTSLQRNIRFAANKLTTSGEVARTTLNVVAIRDGAVGSVRSDASTPEAARDLMRKAGEIAARSKKAPDAHPLPKGSETPGFGQDVDGENFDFFGEMGDELGIVFTDASAADLETFGYTETTEEGVFLATTAGVRDGWFDTRAHLGMTTKTLDWSRSVWSGQTSKSPAELDPGASLRECRKLVDLGGRQTTVDAGRYEVVLSPSCVADMLIWMYWLMSRRDADEGKSVFSDRKAGGNRIGERLFADEVCLESDPNAAGLESIPFVLTSASHSLESVFDNGMPIAPTTWIRDGRLTNLVTTGHQAAKTGSDPVPYSGNLLLSGNGSAGTVDDLIGKVERGLFVNCLWYIRIVDPQTALLTGLTRDGVYLIEEGKITAAVNNFRFNQSPVEMLADVTAMGDPVLTTPREFDDVGLWISAPPAVVSNWNMSTVSEAL